MSLQEDIAICDDKFYDDAKWARHWTIMSNWNSEEATAKRRIEAWERVCRSAQAYENANAAYQEANMEIYRLKCALEGYEQYTTNLEQLINRLQDRIQQSGIKIAELLAEQLEVQLRLHRG